MIFKKECSELIHMSVKFLIIMLLPFISSGFIAFQDGNGGMLSPKINILCSFLFSGFFSTILIRDSIVREKEESTLQMLLLSKFDFFNIVIGKISICVIVGIIFQILQMILMYIIMKISNSSMLEVFNLEVFFLLPWITYLMGSVVLLISIIVNDKKSSEILSMVMALFMGSVPIIIYNECIRTTISFLVFLISLILINIIITNGLKKILVNSMFFIKK